MAADPRLARIEEIDRFLYDNGRWPVISPWWWNVITDFYTSGALGAVAEVGRRGGKSSTICGKVAPAELTTMVERNGELVPFHEVPPGDIAYFAMISAEKPQAKARLQTTKKALQSLGFTLSKDNTEEIILSGQRLGVLAVTASVKGVVSFTCLGALLDEMALWEDEEAKANPAGVVVKTLKPTTATMKQARIWYVSAPFAQMGEHYEMTQNGNTPAQRVYHGATWEANPTLTEAETHLLEEDYASWLRNYAAVPMSSDETKFFAAEMIEAACKSNFAFPRVDTTRAGADLAFRRNSAAIALLQKYAEKIRLAAVDERVPQPKQPLKPSVVLSDFIALAVQYHADAVAADLHYIESLREETDKAAIGLLDYPTDENDRVYVRVRVLLAKGLVDLSRAPKKLIDQLKEVTSKPLDSGRMAIKLKSVAGAHGDLVSALVAGVWALDQVVTLPDRVTTGSRRFGRGPSESDVEKEEAWKGWPI